MAITYRPTDTTLTEIDALKAKYKISTTTKLLDFLVENHEKLKQEISDLKQERYEINRDLDDKSKVIYKFQAGLKGLLETEIKNPYY